jgi:hypothetical protein
VLLGISGSSAAFWLGLYASVVSSLVALVTLYSQTLARIRVQAREDFFVRMADGGQLVASGKDALEAMGARLDQAVPVLNVGMSNRGRNTVQITMVSKAHPVKRDLFADAMPQLPLVLEPGHLATVVIGKEGGYAHGDLKNLRRFFVADGAGRIYPYRERWRQRLENLLYRRAVIWWRKRSHRARESSSARRGGR